MRQKPTLRFFRRGMKTPVTNFLHGARVSLFVKSSNHLSATNISFIADDYQQRDARKLCISFRRRSVRCWSSCAPSSFDIFEGGGQNPLSSPAANRTELNTRRTMREKKPFFMRRILSRLHSKNANIRSQFRATFSRCCSYRTAPHCFCSVNRPN